MNRIQICYIKLFWLLNNQCLQRTHLYHQTIRISITPPRCLHQGQRRAWKSYFMARVEAWIKDSFKCHRFTQFSIKISLWCSSIRLAVTLTIKLSRNIIIWALIFQILEGRAISRLKMMWQMALNSIFNSLCQKTKRTLLGTGLGHCHNQLMNFKFQNLPGNLPGVISTQKQTLHKWKRKG